jgi:hypothetical protein
LTVINPADHGIVEGADWSDYLRHDIRQLVTCEVIALLPGWSTSRGANLELHIATALGMLVYPLGECEGSWQEFVFKPDLAAIV